MLKNDGTFGSSEEVSVTGELPEERMLGAGTSQPNQGMGVGEKSEYPGRGEGSVRISFMRDHQDAVSEGRVWYHVRRRLEEEVGWEGQRNGWSNCPSPSASLFHVIPWPPAFGLSLSCWPMQQW